jgi:hypothetical protein
MIFELYCLFAITTSIVAIYELLMPVIRRRREELGGPVPDTASIYITTFLINILVAPLVFFSCIIPSWGERFRKALYDGLFPKDSEIQR